MSASDPGEPGLGDQPPSLGDEQPQAPAVAPRRFRREAVGVLGAGIGAAATLFLVALALPWIRFSYSGADFHGSYSENGFGRGLLVFAGILLVAATVWVLLPAFGISTSKLAPRSVVPLVLNGLAFIFTLVQFIDAVGGGTLGDLGFDAGPGIGAFLGFFAALGAAALGSLQYRADQRTLAQPRH